MDSSEYRKAAQEVTDFIAKYYATIRERRINPQPPFDPGYLCKSIPLEPPINGEPWSAIFSDVDNLILPGLTHWASPFNHAYFPELASYPSLLGDMLADGFNNIGFTWASSPACTELETLVMDWLALMIGLPDKFVHLASKSTGGGVIQTSQNDATFVSLLAARNNAIARQMPTIFNRTPPPAIRKSPLIPTASLPTHKPPTTHLNNESSAPSTPPACKAIPTQKFLQKFLQTFLPPSRLEQPNAEQIARTRGEITAKLVAYCSDQAHNSVEKSCNAALIELCRLESNECFELDASTLEKAIAEDFNRGKMPFYVCATLGTPGTCAFDHLEAISQVCSDYGLWLHVDAAYAGAAFVCPEHRHFLAGIENAQSFAFNPSQWLLTAFDCTAMWVADSRHLHRTFNVDPLYLKHDKTGSAVDFMHWQIPLSRRFRSLKLWCVIRCYGVSGLQQHIRRCVERAQQFVTLMVNDGRFEMMGKPNLGVVTFRLNGQRNVTTEQLIKLINLYGEIKCGPVLLKGTSAIRFIISSTNTTQDDIERDFKLIQAYTAELLSSKRSPEVEHLEVEPDPQLETQRRRSSTISANRRPSFLTTPKCPSRASTNGDSPSPNS